MELLRVEDFRWQRGDFLLDIPRLTLAVGAMCVVRGPNGAGKSSLLRLLALLETAQAGKLYLSGTEVRRSNRLRMRRDVTLVEQEPWLLRSTVAANLDYGLARRGLTKLERHDRIEKALAAVGLDGSGGRQAQTLSVGEGRRVALARALALQPRLLLLDEPTAGLDGSSLNLVAALLPQLATAGTALVMASHDADLAGRLGAAEIRLERGRLAE